MSESIVEEVMENFKKEIIKEEQKNIIQMLLKAEMSPKWIHNTLNYQIELIEQVQNSIIN